MPDSIKFQIIYGVWSVPTVIKYYILFTVVHCMMLNTYFQTSKLVSVVKSKINVETRRRLHLKLVTRGDVWL